MCYNKVDFFIGIGRTLRLDKIIRKRVAKLKDTKQNLTQLTEVILHNRSWMIMLFPFLISLIISLYNINIPFEIHEFRQAQTAITVQDYLRDGVKVLGYRVPVFGDNSVIPFEFPIFQLSSYAVHRAANFFAPISFDLSCRVTNLAYFYLTCLLLYFLCDLILSEKRSKYYILLLYMFNPFCIIWSRTSMIDYCSVFFSMGYAYFFIKFLKNGVDKYFLLIPLCGIMAYLSKVTTVLAFDIIIAYYGVLFLMKIRDLTPKNTRFQIILILFCVIVPLLCGLAWTKWTDYQKILSGHEWLTSSALRTWNFGRLSDKFNITSFGWRIIAERMFLYFSPVAWLCALGIFFYMGEKNDFRVILASIFSVFFTIFTFYNLYQVHDYYLMAVSPLLCMFLGYGVFCVINLCIKYKRPVFIFLVIAGHIMVTSSSAKYYTSLYFSKYNDHFRNRQNLQLANYINNNTNEDDRILIFDSDWSSEILYYAERVGFMWRHEGLKKILPQRDYFSLVALQNIELHKELLLELMPLVLLNEIGSWKIYTTELIGDVLQDISLKKTETTHYHIDDMKILTDSSSISVIADFQDTGYVRIDEEANKNLVIAGWAVDFPDNSAGSAVFIKISDNMYPTRRVLRSDVAEHFKEPNFMSSGFIADIDISDLTQGLHDAQIILLTSDKKGYYVLSEFRLFTAYR